MLKHSANDSRSRPWSSNPTRIKLGDYTGLSIAFLIDCFFLPSFALAGSMIDEMSSLSRFPPSSQSCVGFSLPAKQHKAPDKKGLEATLPWPITESPNPVTIALSHHLATQTAASRPETFTGSYQAIMLALDLNPLMQTKRQGLRDEATVQPHLKKSRSPTGEAFFKPDTAHSQNKAVFITRIVCMKTTTPPAPQTTAPSPTALKIEKVTSLDTAAYLHEPAAVARNIRATASLVTHAAPLNRSAFWDSYGLSPYFHLYLAWLSTSLLIGLFLKHTLGTSHDPHEWLKINKRVVFDLHNGYKIAIKTVRQ